MHQMRVVIASFVNSFSTTSAEVRSDADLVWTFPNLSEKAPSILNLSDKVQKGPEWRDADILQQQKYAIIALQPKTGVYRGQIQLK